MSPNIDIFAGKNALSLIRDGGLVPDCVCHCEGATRSEFMTEWKIFSELLIEILATEESPVPSLH
jgi:hypothetical protein